MRCLRALVCRRMDLGSSLAAGLVRVCRAVAATQSVGLGGGSFLEASHSVLCRSGQLPRNLGSLTLRRRFVFVGRLILASGFEFLLEQVVEPSEPVLVVCGDAQQPGARVLHLLGVALGIEQGRRLRLSCMGEFDEFANAGEALDGPRQRLQRRNLVLQGTGGLVPLQRLVGAAHGLRPPR